MTTSITFSDFNEDILELIWSKDPLDLNSDIETYQTSDSKAKTEIELWLETKMEESYDAIPHYLKSNFVNINNNADSKEQDQIRSKTSPTLQVNIPNTQTTITHSISSDNLAKNNLSLKSFENIVS